MNIFYAVLMTILVTAFFVCTIAGFMQIDIPCTYDEKEKWKHVKRRFREALFFLLCAIWVGMTFPVTIL